ncbi:MAG: hypothetical protein WBA39_35165 [Rivularia sp. (in: cyanobacteria)]
MSNNTPHIKNQEYSVNIDQYFSRGWEIFKQYPGGFIGFLLVIFVISIFFNFLAVSVENIYGIVSIANFVLNPIFSAGFYIVALQIAKNRPIDFSDFFRGFNQFMQIFLVYLIGNILIAIGFLFFIIPGIYLAVAYVFSSLFVIEKKLSFWSALEASRKLITKKWFSFVGLGIMLTLLNLAGLLLLGIGALVTIPLSSCIMVAAFEDIVGLNGA